MDLKRRLQTTNPEDISLGRVIRFGKRRLKYIPFRTKWLLSEKGKDSRQKLQLIKGKHAGERCFIIANGPSLKKMDLSLLKDEVVIGMNRIYLLDAFMKTKTRYLAVSDLELQLKQFTNEYTEYSGTKFFRWDSNDLFPIQPNLTFFFESFNSRFSEDISKVDSGTGNSVTYFCMQLAYHLGFKEVYLIGKDHSYNAPGKAGNRLISDGKEDNHFIKGYYKPGQKFGVPHYAGEEFSYKLARKAFEKNGRIIKDATIGGKLEIFEKVDFYSLFKK